MLNTFPAWSSVTRLQATSCSIITFIFLLPPYASLFPLLVTAKSVSQYCSNRQYCVHRDESFLQKYHPGYQNVPYAYLPFLPSQSKWIISLTISWSVNTRQFNNCQKRHQFMTYPLQAQSYSKLATSVSLQDKNAYVRSPSYQQYSYQPHLSGNWITTGCNHKIRIRIDSHIGIFFFLILPILTAP